MQLFLFLLTSFPLRGKPPVPEICSWTPSLGLISLFEYLVGHSAPRGFIFLQRWKCYSLSNGNEWRPKLSNIPNLCLVTCKTKNCCSCLPPRASNAWCRDSYRPLSAALSRPPFVLCGCGLTESPIWSQTSMICIVACICIHTVSRRHSLKCSVFMTIMKLWKMKFLMKSL